MKLLLRSAECDFVRENQIDIPQKEKYRTTEQLLLHTSVSKKTDKCSNLDNSSHLTVIKFQMAMANGTPKYLIASPSYSTGGSGAGNETKHKGKDMSYYLC